MTSEDPSSTEDRKGAALPGDSLAQTVAGMSDAELRELAGAVLAELRARIADPASQGFSYQHLVSDLQRRLADAHAYARSGFGHRDKRLTTAAGSRPLPASTPLSEEKKARVLVGLEAELIPDAGADRAAANGTADRPAGALARDGSGRPDGGEAPAGDGSSASSFEDEIWQALQVGVGRSATRAPMTKEDPPLRQSGIP